MSAWLNYIADFHFLRPWWLLALLPSALLALLLFREQQQAGRWQSVIAADLLPFLLDNETQQRRHRHFSWALVLWLLGTIALAGPSWTKTSLPIHKQQTPLVILFELSPSMLAEDIKPSRLARARLKLTDLLNRRHEGTTALVAFAHDAHVVTPLTDDTSTIISLVPALDPTIMPIAGSRPVLALQKGLELAMQAGHQSGELLLVTDGIADGDQAAMAGLLKNLTGFRLSILAVGSQQGAPIPASGGGFIKNRQGEIVIAGLQVKPLQQLASQSGGRFAELVPDDSDIDYLTARNNLPGAEAKRLERTFDTWQDRGFWLILPLLPILLLAFRRNLIALLLVAPLLVHSDKSLAFEWADLWLRADQQGQQAFAAGDMETATQRFENPTWKGAAAYRSEKFDVAQQAFAENESATGRYNLGNSLARAGQLEEALKAYDQALAAEPGDEDAAFNKKLVEDLLNKREENSDQNQQQGQQQDQQEQDKPSSENKSGQNSSEGSQEQEQKNEQANNSDGSNSDEPASSEPYDPAEHSDRKKPEQQVQDDSSAEPSANEEGQEQPGEQTPDQAEANAQASDSGSPQDKMSSEQRQALEQWLRRVPDDPGGLLRRKFAYEAWLRQQQGDTNDGEEQRW